MGVESLRRERERMSPIVRSASGGGAGETTCRSSAVGVEDGTRRWMIKGVVSVGLLSMVPRAILTRENADCAIGIGMRRWKEVLVMHACRQEAIKRQLHMPACRLQRKHPQKKTTLKECVGPPDAHKDSSNSRKKLLRPEIRRYIEVGNLISRTDAEWVISNSWVLVEERSV